MPYFCYILECSDGTYYTGWTTDPKRRAKQHNQGHGARYTSTRRPVRMVYIEPQADRTTAMRRERTIKAMDRRRKARLIAQGKPEDPGAQVQAPVEDPSK
jgi:putative endonuclease